MLGTAQPAVAPWTSGSHHGSQVTPREHGPSPTIPCTMLGQRASWPCDTTRSVCPHAQLALPARMACLPTRPHAPWGHSASHGQWPFDPRGRGEIPGAQGLNPCPLLKGSRIDLTAQRLGTIALLGCRGCRPPAHEAICSWRRGSPEHLADSKLFSSGSDSSRRVGNKSRVSGLSKPGRSEAPCPGW